MAKISDAWKVDESGKRVKCYVIRYLDKSKLNAKGKPVHRQEKFDKKKHAESRLLVINNELADGFHIAKTAGMTVAAVVEEFMRFQEDRVKDGRIGRGTLKVYDCEMRNSVVPRLGGKIIHKLTATDIEDFYRAMVRLDGLKPLTAKDRVASFREVCRFARRRKYIKDEVVSDALRDLRGVGAPAIRTFTPEQVVDLLREAEIRGPRKPERTHAMTRCVVHIAAFCGLRFGEIMGLTIGNVDLAAMVVRVRHNLTVFDELKAPKTRSGVRDVPMPAHCAEMVRDYIARFYQPNPRGLIFRTGLGGLVSGPSFHEWHWRPLLDRAGLGELDGERLHFHALRHFAASWWIGRGMPVTDVASLLGHRTFDTTLQTYAHPITGGHARRDMVESMTASLLPVPVTIDLAPATAA